MPDCLSCRESRAIKEFRPGRRQCRPCERAACREYGVANRAKRNKRLSAWRKTNPAAAKANDRRKALRKNYSLTEEQVAKMNADQEGRCLLCREIKFLVIDHCHKTGRVRGLLCHRCNLGLGWFESHQKMPERVAAYLGQPCHADVLLELANVGMDEAA